MDAGSAYRLLEVGDGYISSRAEANTERGRDTASGSIRNNDVALRIGYADELRAAGLHA